MQPSLGLQVTLASQLPILHAQPSLTIPVKVSVHNTGSDPVTFLKWGTPFDAHAAVSGVFEVCDTADGTLLALDVLKMSRKLPASAEDLIEVAGGQVLDNMVELRGIHFQEGHDYSIVTKGIWHAIWKEPLASVTASQLADFSGANRGEFRSNVALVKIE
ncbi:uncharacterized protein N7496_007611 [Penicillium cataractarum]|uniref:Uncharacterized protein n=1 Tax=Penicillium cataractarum TaxID=2100454 RepID=A0A9W9S5U6_9EURO|nr:uncharacterized protein N7496_007611 [Penicillium cataractarum]KAJ5371519.1 hypothetical protein N7496_007611 [Penicillium cataractarum]